MLACQEHGQRDDERRGVIKLVEHGARAAIVHRRAGIDDERDAHVAFFFILLDVMTIRARIDPPVEPPQVVARIVIAILGELDVEPVERTAVLAADRPFNEPPRA